MNILYLSTSYVPSRTASSIQVMRMCEALARHGNKVLLAVKDNADRHEETPLSDHEFYGVEPIFSIEKIARPSFKGGGVLYTLGVWRLVWRRRKRVDIVFSRDILGGWIASRLGLPVIFEAHGVPRTPALRRQFYSIIHNPNFRRLIVISQELKDDLAANNLLPPDEKVIILHDGAKPFDEGKTTNGVVLDKTNGRQWHAGYIGQLYQGKGMEVILPLSRELPDVCFHVVGGEEDDLRRWKAKEPPDNLYFHGFVSPGELNDFYKQFDILLLPPQHQVYGSSGQSEIGRWMSPMKMFEYMSAGKPIISSNLPVLMEVLTHEKNALLASPEAIEEWITAVKRIQSDPELAKRIGQQARQDLLENYTWSARARKALAGLDTSNW